MQTLHVMTDCSFSNDIHDPNLENLQAAVGGLIQAIDLAPELTMWCNDEGKLMGLPVNPVATALWTRYYGETDVIVGNGRRLDSCLNLNLRRASGKLRTSTPVNGSLSFGHASVRTLTGCCRWLQLG